MDQKIAQYLLNLPNIIEPTVEMHEANQGIPIYEGEFTLVMNGNPIKIGGKIYFDWFPVIGGKFSGRVLDKKNKIDFISMLENENNIEIDSLYFGKAFIVNQKGDEIQGRLIGEAILGDKSINVTKIKFSIPNLRDFLGEPVKVQEARNVGTYTNRILLENDEFVVKIDKNLKFTEHLNSLKSRGGYIILYNGEILAKKRRDINYNTLANLIPCLSKFLSFLNGRRTAPLFFQGIHDDKIIWTSFTGYPIDQYKEVETWPQKHSIAGFNDLWQSFYKLWVEENGKDKDFLNTAVHWYVEANSNTGFVEGAIILAQICLELIYNWLIIEKNKLLIGKDGENISASNKFRLLISQFRGSAEVPAALSTLKNLVDSNNDMADGVDAFVQIRNAIIHSQEEKRKKLETWDDSAKYEALQFSLKIIELSLLYILGFKGKYFDRCSGAKWVGDGEEMVPYL